MESNEERYRKALLILADNLFGAGDPRPIARDFQVAMVVFINHVLNGKEVQEAIDLAKKELNT